MGQHLYYLYSDQWFTEGQTAVFTITLREPAVSGTVGTVISVTSLATCVLTLYDLSGGTYAIVNAVEQTNIKNTGRATISSQGVLVLTLTPTDMAILNATKAYEVRRALIEITWPITPTKADAYEIDFVIRNLARRPYVAPPP